MHMKTWCYPKYLNPGKEKECSMIQACMIGYPLEDKESSKLIESAEMYNMFWLHRDEGSNWFLWRGRECLGVGTERGMRMLCYETIAKEVDEEARAHHEHAGFSTQGWDPGYAILPNEILRVDGDEFDLNPLTELELYFLFRRCYPTFCID